jgi:hypothetical protein
MTSAQSKRGGAPVGFITELGGIEAASVICLRLWCDGPDSQSQVWNKLASALGAGPCRRAVQAFEKLLGFCIQHGRRPLMRHAVNCNCLGADESCFANFIATAAEGEREDAMLIATLLVRADVAPLITSLATDFGLALKRMQLCASKNKAPDRKPTPSQVTLHYTPLTPTPEGFGLR